MHCVRKINNDLWWVGANDRRLAMFEGVYSVPKGVSYNAYLLFDEKTVLFDTVDKAVGRVFFENLAHILGGRNLDYVVVQHMEPDHSATLTELLLRYPGVTIVCNAKTAAMIGQFFGLDITGSARLVKEGDTLFTGRHELRFLMAPMVHWPEVMVTYDQTDKILFSADAFGSFGALNGALFNDEVDFDRDYLDEFRRYYTNIVGKYGNQVQSLLKKAGAVEIGTICPLHGFVWRNHLGDILEKYDKWSRYEPEENGVLLAYASVYGDTENAAEILATCLRKLDVKVEMFDVSVTPASEIVAAAFRWSHLVFASTTYNAGIFVSMDELIRDLVAHNIQNRRLAFIENGSWAPTAGKLMTELLAPLKGMEVIGSTLTLKSALHEDQLESVAALAEAISATMLKFAPPAPEEVKAEGVVEPTAMFQFTYGLFVLSAREGSKDNGCIINTAIQVTDSPKRISIAINKANLTHDMILRTGKFNISVLTEEAPFGLFQQFGFQSGRNVEKFAESQKSYRTANGLLYLPDYTNAVISGKVISAADYGTHTLFVAEVTEARVLSHAPSVTYAYYFAHIKPKPQTAAVKKKGFICKICGYIYEGETLPPDFICPICKHGAEAFEPLEQ